MVWRHRGFNRWVPPSHAPLHESCVVSGSPPQVSNTRSLGLKRVPALSVVPTPRREAHIVFWADYGPDFPEGRTGGGLSPSRRPEKLNAHKEIMFSSAFIPCYNASLSPSPAFKDYRKKPLSCVLLVTVSIRRGDKISTLIWQFGGVPEVCADWDASLLEHGFFPSGTPSKTAPFLLDKELNKRMVAIRFEQVQGPEETCKNGFSGKSSDEVLVDMQSPA